MRESERERERECERERVSERYKTYVDLNRVNNKLSVVVFSFLFGQQEEQDQWTYDYDE